MSVKVHNDVVVQKPETDPRVFRFASLPNGIRVLLIHDPQSSMGKFAVNVDTGSIHDPEALPGLAHFLEHMLFMGSQKYPQPGEVDTFLAAHGGSISNAWTSNTQTVYYLDVASDALAIAVDRFADCFVAPKFAPSAVDKEMNAVDSEMAQYKRHDENRVEWAVLRRANKDHPLSRFTVGNLETLRDEPKKQGIDPVTAVREFWQTHYSADQMSLVMLSDHSIEDMCKMLEPFAKVKKLSQPPPQGEHVAPMPPFVTGKQMPTLVRMVPMSNIRTLQLSWIVPEQISHWRCKPGSVMSAVIGHEGRHSLLALLKKRGLAVELCCGESLEPNVGGITSVECSVTLSERGDQQPEKVAALVCAYLDKLRASGGVPQWFLDEQMKLANTSFRFLPQDGSPRVVAGLAAAMSHYPDDKVFAAPYIMEETSATQVANLLAALTRDNLFIVHNSKAYDSQKQSEGWETDHYYDFYSNSQLLVGADLDKWTKLPFDDDWDFHFLDVNPYVPEDFPIAQPVSGEADYPELVPTDDCIKSKLFHMTGKRFNLPWAIMQFSVTSRVAVAGDLKKCVVLDLMNATAIEMIQEELYHATAAHLNFRCQHVAHNQGNLGSFDVTVSGLSPKFALLVQRGFTALRKTTSLDKDCFERVKESRRSALDEALNASRLGPHVRALLARCMVSTGAAPKALLDALQAVTFDECQALASSGDAWKEVCVDALSLGNISRDQAKELIADVAKILESDGSKLRKEQPVKVVEVTNTARARVTELVNNDLEENSALGVFFSMGKWTVENSAKLAVLQKMLEDMLFNNLRTRQQLGYTTGMMSINLGGRLQVGFFVQSAKMKSKELQIRMDGFTECALFGLENHLNSKKFDSYKSATLSVLKEEPKNIREELALFWGRIVGKDYEMDHISKKVRYLETLTLDEFNKWTAQFAKLHAVSCCMETQVDVAASATAGASCGEGEEDGEAGGAQSPEECLEIITPYAPTRDFNWKDVDSPLCIFHTAAAHGVF